MKAIEMIAVVKNHFVIRCLTPNMTVQTLSFADLNCKESFGTKISIDCRPKSLLSNKSKIFMRTSSVGPSAEKI